jgi:RimJ/RimL family protein N-acetyltransferase
MLQGEEFYKQSFGFPPANGLRDFFVSKDVSPDWLAQLETAKVADVWTHGFALVHVADSVVIGAGSFKGPPGLDGVVEIAYGVVPDYQGQGYATEAAQALTVFAFRDGCVAAVRAHTLPEPNASTRVLVKCGFRFVGDRVDPEDGLVWRWEKLPEKT